MQKVILYLLLTVLYFTTDCLACHCTHRNIKEIFSISDFVVAIEITSGRTEESGNYYWNYKMLQVYKENDKAWKALEQKKIWTATHSCGQFFNEGDKKIISGKVDENGQASTMACVNIFTDYQDGKDHWFKDVECYVYSNSQSTHHFYKNFIPLILSLASRLFPLRS